MAKLLFQHSIAAVLVIASGSLAAAEVESEMSLSYGDGEHVQVSSRSQVKNWYITGYNNSQFVSSGENNDVDSWFFNGGYQHKLRNELSLFVEAGVNNQYDDIATRKGFNLSTGVNYQPLKSLSIQSKLVQVHQPKYDNTEHSLELSSTYHLLKNIDVKAVYQVEAQQDRDTQQQVQFGLGYRF
ncbi:MtrB/PioB family outer membrane beta-barrel protein [Agarivorans aestuarii]|uniref:MtrB/PioB family outer membrane beta-barrel protein n=1 Tax=Agarivorans aestuarii TaxID=1563703 RepID=A0ABU7G864_9ALTE|nr:MULTISPECIES: MtrB/PioB family outer membrane beta-barrel protein [Agarivorans]MEE1675526.1 MtrB/PioB family outer membrane beta-barrel protein [Agarivorans aestuarii]